MCEQAECDVRGIGEDRGAFECLYVEHIDLIQAFLARRVSDPSLVADLTSEVFLTAIGEEVPAREGHTDRLALRDRAPRDGR